MYAFGGRREGDQRLHLVERCKHPVVHKWGTQRMNGIIRKIGSWARENEREPEVRSKELESVAKTQGHSSMHALN